MAKVEDFDAKLLRILRENARTSNSAIARRLGVSEGAVRKRIANLVSAGVIKRFTVETAEEGMVNALCFVSVAAGAQTGSVAKRIASLPGVRRVLEITGEFDLVAVVGGESVEEVNATVDEIRRIPRVKATDTKIVLKAWEKK
ncbi:MAG: Lrp/AsnC family transcriptional regulator [Candidatus Micrarchaeia archaeon]